MRETVSKAPSLPRMNWSLSPWMRCVPGVPAPLPGLSPAARSPKKPQSIRPGAYECQTIGKSVSSGPVLDCPTAASVGSPETSRCLFCWQLLASGRPRNEGIAATALLAVLSPPVSPVIYQPMISRHVRSTLGEIVRGAQLPLRMAGFQRLWWRSCSALVAARGDGIRLSPTACSPHADQWLLVAALSSCRRNGRLRGHRCIWSSCWSCDQRPNGVSFGYYSNGGRLFGCDCRWLIADVGHCDWTIAKAVSLAIACCLPYFPQRGLIFSCCHR